MLKFLKNSRGVAAIEFAILLPFMLVVLYGAFQVSLYVMTVRRIDNVANDLGYIISREGAILEKNVDDVPTLPYTGGKRILENIIKNVTPFLIGGKVYNPDAPDANIPQVMVKYVGLPRFPNSDPLAGCGGSTVDQETLRVMWGHVYPATSTNSVNSSLGSANPCLGGLCVKSCANSVYNSFYSEGGYGGRADIIFPGQAFVIVNFAGRFDSFFNDSYPVIGFLMPKKLEKVSSYAVRSRWIDVNVDNIVQATELLNFMHMCVDCTLSSDSTDTDGLKAGNAPIRQTCSNPVAPGNEASGGCSFY